MLLSAAPGGREGRRWSDNFGSSAVSTEASTIPMGTSETQVAHEPRD